MRGLKASQGMGKEIRGVSVQAVKHSSAGWGEACRPQFVLMRANSNGHRAAEIFWSRGSLAEGEHAWPHQLKANPGGDTLGSVGQLREKLE